MRSLIQADREVVLDRKISEIALSGYRCRLGFVLHFPKEAWKMSAYFKVEL
jgi:hypothetical protein